MSLNLSDIPDPQVREWYRNKVSGSATAIPTVPPPSILQLEVTKNCNFACIMCHKGQAIAAGGDFNRADISDIALSQIKCLYPYLKQAVLFGDGEPMVYRNFWQIVQDIREASPDCMIDFINNGSMMNQRNIENCFRFKVSHLGLSIGGATAASHAIVRPPGKFDLIIDNYRALLKEKRIRKTYEPYVTAHMVVMQANYKELEQLITLCADLGFLAVELQKLFITHSMVDDQIVNDTDLEPYLSAAQITAKRRRIGFSHYPLESGKFYGVPAVLFNPKHRLFQASYAPHQLGGYCLFQQPWNTVYVLHDGSVVPDCHWWESRRLSHLNSCGRLDENRNILDIWNGPIYQEIRTRILEGKILPQCRGCGLAGGVKSEFRCDATDHTNPAQEQSNCELTISGSSPTVPVNTPPAQHVMSSKVPLVSVVIPTVYPAGLRLCLQSLIHHGFDPVENEIILAIDENDVLSRDHAETLSIPVKQILIPENPDRWQMNVDGWMAGIRASKNDLIWMLHDDIEIMTPELLPMYLTLMQSTTWGRKTGICGQSFGPTTLPTGHTSTMNIELCCAMIHKDFVFECSKFTGGNPLWGEWKPEHLGLKSYDYSVVDQVFIDAGGKFLYYALLSPKWQPILLKAPVYGAQGETHSVNNMFVHYVNSGSAFRHKEQIFQEKHAIILDRIKQYPNTISKPRRDNSNHSYVQWRQHLSPINILDYDQKRIQKYNPHFNYEAWLDNIELVENEKNGKDTLLRSYPIYIDMELQNTCNFSCLHCNSAVGTRGETFGKNNIQKVLNIIKYAEVIELSKIAEPFMDVKEFVDITTRIRELNPLVVMKATTNGSKMSQEVIDHLVDIEFECLTVSIDTTDKEFYAKFRRRGNFDVLIENLRKFTTTKRNKPYPVLHVSCQVTSHCDTPAIVDLCHDIGANTVWFGRVAVYPENERRYNLSEITNDYYKNLDTMREQLSAARDKCQNYGIGMGHSCFDGIPESYATGVPREFVMPTYSGRYDPQLTCPSGDPWYRFCSNPLKSVSPCCFHPGFDTIDGKEIMTLRNHPFLVQLRKDIAEGLRGSQCGCFVSSRNTSSTIPCITCQDSIFVFSMKRAGNHACASWILGHYPEPHLYFPNHTPFTPLRQPFVGRRSNDAQVACLVAFEDRDLEQLDFTRLIVDPINGQRHFNVLVLRDPFNQFVSALFSWSVKNYVLADPLLVRERWKQYAREYLGSTNYMPDKILFNFNKWFENQEYRLSISKQLGFSLNDAGLNRMWVDSSFDYMAFNGNAQAMRVLDRFSMCPPEILVYMRKLLDDEVWDLSERIFGSDFVDRVHKILPRE